MSDETVIDGGGLRIVFARVGDRYAHTIGWIDRSNFMPLLQSVEGTASDNWPPSPPLQSLHLEDGPAGRRLAMLVGMAGRSHWSMSMELDPAAQTVTCDVACRVHAAPLSLTSAYCLTESVRTTRDGEVVQLVSGSHTFELSVHSGVNQGCTVEMNAASPLIHVCTSKPQTLPQTARWRYSIVRLSK